MDGTPATPPTTIPVQQGAVACSLSPGAAEAQLREWHDLVRFADQVEPLPNGARLTLPADRSGEIADLVAREQACCSFLTITTESAERTVTVDITSSHPDAAVVIDALTRSGHA